MLACGGFGWDAMLLVCGCRSGWVLGGCDIGVLGWFTVGTFAWVWWFVVVLAVCRFWVLWLGVWCGWLVLW